MMKQKESNKICIVVVTFLSIIVGVTIVTEAGINIALSEWSGNPLRASFINFTIATLTLLPLTIFCKHDKQNDSNVNEKDVNIINNILNSLKKSKRNCLVFTNGTCSVIWVCSLIFITPQIGFALFIICAIIGQIIASMLIDNFGLVWSSKKPSSLLNILGAIIAIIGVILFQIPTFQSSTMTFLYFIYAFFAFFAGVFITIQAGLNQRLQCIMMGTPYQSSFASFLNGTVLLLVINVIICIIYNDWFEVDNKYLEWHIFFGGAMGAFTVTMLIICPTYIGFVATYVCAIFGQLITSLAYDALGAFGVHSTMNTISILKIIGVLCVFCGCIMVNLKQKSQSLSQQSTPRSLVTQNEMASFNTECVEQITNVSHKKLKSHSTEIEVLLETDGLQDDENKNDGSFNAKSHLSNHLEDQYKALTTMNFHEYFDWFSDDLGAVNANQTKQKIISDILPKIKTLNHYLEIGPARGHLLKTLSSFFNNITIMEPNPLFTQHLSASIDNIKNFKIIQKMLQDVDFNDDYFSKNKFDLIIMQHVLWHVPLHKWNDILDDLQSKCLNNDDQSNATLIITLACASGTEYDIYKHFVPEIRLIDYCLNYFEKKLDQNKYHIELYKTKDTVAMPESTAINTFFEIIKTNFKIYNPQIAEEKKDEIIAITKQLLQRDGHYSNSMHTNGEQIINFVAEQGHLIVTKL
eukprot:407057_1